MEAAAMGLHLIVPNHSAYTTYLDESVARMIPVRRVPAKFGWNDGPHKLYHGADWWEPDEDAVADYIHKAITNDSEEKNLAARMRIAKEFTWKKATIRLIEILEERHAIHQQTVKNRGSELW